MQNINLNILPNDNPTLIKFSQNDVGRTTKIYLFDEEGSYSIPSGATIKIRGTKPSGLGFDEACTFSNNCVTVTSKAIMTDEAGRFPVELRITSGNNILGTANMQMWVQRNPHPDGTTDGQGEQVVPALTALINQVTTAAEEATATAAAAQATADQATVKADAAAETIEDAYDTMEGYVDQARIYKEEAFSGTPAGYDALVQSVTDNYNIYGSKNLVLPRYDTPVTIEGITFERNIDGSITANGTATGIAYYRMPSNSDWNTLPAGKYTLTGSPAGSSSSTYYSYVSRHDGIKHMDYGSGVTFTLPESKKTRTVIAVNSGVTVNNLVFYPMIRAASISDSTYEPYAMTNQELTNISSAYIPITIGGVTSGENECRILRIGKVVMFRLTLGKNTAFDSFDSQDVIGTIPAGFRPARFYKDTSYFSTIARDIGSVNTATYYPAILSVIRSSGEMKLSGNKDALKTCKYINDNFVWLTD